MQGVDLGLLEGVMRLMKTYGVPELQIGELHLTMPSAVTTAESQKPVDGIGFDSEGNVITDPLLHGAVANVRGHD